MLTTEMFAQIARGLRGCVEASHMGHPDFRVGGRIFASLQPQRGIGVAKLTPEQQQELLEAHPDVFAAQAGAWGRQGWTSVRLDTADAELAGTALTLAWGNVTSAATGRTTSPRPRTRRR